MSLVPRYRECSECWGGLWKMFLCLLVLGLLTRVKTIVRNGLIFKADVYLQLQRMLTCLPNTWTATFLVVLIIILPSLSSLKKMALTGGFHMLHT